MAFFLLCALFSLAGVPPFLGFWAKLIVLRRVIMAHETGLAIFAVVMAVVAAYYYLRVVKSMYFDPPPAPGGDGAAAAAPVPVFSRVWLGINALGLLVLGILPEGLWSACRMAMSHLLR